MGMNVCMGEEAEGNCESESMSIIVWVGWNEVRWGVDMAVEK